MNTKSGNRNSKAAYAAEKKSPGSSNSFTDSKADSYEEIIGELSKQQRETRSIWVKRKRRARRSKGKEKNV